MQIFKTFSTSQMRDFSLISFSFIFEFKLWKISLKAIDENTVKFLILEKNNDLNSFLSYTKLWDSSHNREKINKKKR